MASFRPFPPPHNSLVPPSGQPPLPPPPQGHYPRNRSYTGSQPSVPSSSYPPPPNYNQIHPNSNVHHAYNSNAPPQHFGPSRLQQQQYPYPSFQRPTSVNLQPQQQSSNSLYYPPQYSQFEPAPPPPPPPVPPPPSSPPPPPPPSLPPPPPPPAPVAPPPPPASAAPPPSHHHSLSAKEAAVGMNGPEKSNLPLKPQKGSAVNAGKAGLLPPPSGPTAVVRIVETEEERRLRKKREYEKQKMEEKRRQQMKEARSNVLHKGQMASTQAVKPHGSVTGSRMGERRAGPFLGGERIENRLKKPTTFLCKLK